MFRCILLSSIIRQSIRSQLWKDVDEKVADALVDYLSNHDVGEEDPILAVEYLPHLETVSNLSIINFQHIHILLMLITLILCSWWEMQFPGRINFSFELH